MTEKMLSELKEDPKTYLRGIANIEERINDKLQERERYEAMSTEITQQMSAAPAFSTYKQSKVENAVVQMEALLQDIGEEIKELREARKIRAEAIDLVDDTRLQTILEKVYLNRKDFFDIAVDLGIGYDRVLHLHGAALNKLKNL